MNGYQQPPMQYPPINPSAYQNKWNYGGPMYVPQTNQQQQQQQQVCFFFEQIFLSIRLIILVFPNATLVRTISTRFYTEKT